MEKAAVVVKAEVEEEEEEGVKVGQNLSIATTIHRSTQ
jgi:hypothetical protein